MIFKPDSIVVHHSLTADSQTVSWPAIRQYHIETMGMKDVAYHSGCELIATGYEALLGRPWDEEGAHCKQNGMNSHSLGVCLVGNFDASPPPHEQMVVAVERIIKPWMRLYSIPPGRIFFHREFAPYKSCPGAAFKMAYLGQYIPGVRPGI